MSEKKKIVSIEDRIPKLKQARKKKANRRLIFYLSIFFVLIFIIVYLQSPLSNIHRLEVEGNEFLPKETIIQSSGLTTSDNMWRIDKDEAIKRIEENEEVEKVSISRGFPATVTIKVTELGRVGYLQQDNSYRALLTNGSISEKKWDQPNSDAPTLYGFSDDKYLKELAEELGQLPASITGLISEIHYKPTEDNQFVIQLFMNDGREVQGTIRTFATNMEAYPSIAAQLDPDVDGVLHMGVGTYFEPAEKEKEDSEQEEGQ
ncbi:cell division protein FtsQ [Terribacillus saccharophilus]|jgi:cell division protein FtsQ|uniref:Cell division protein DivIB n=1 Tax=Terribacillus saccharophilus TaxID=361277 RepID=A0A268HCD0_9BACI|nr:FtsQ-type POTRA domain-containing protein [Terribacillus saccharophilus]PAD37246.1 cell division protein FtsQ [Terribacillus saccharophilus]PAD97342.1 cell division protein FtsQ [Terribacillus saccharophilus]PAE01390.1 cell division protein FtsQ [Terribacillus saccharophilus]PAE07525.1 cell division protein FtsQ [Terribacillus saccharophilus]